MKLTKEEALKKIEELKAYVEQADKEENVPWMPFEGQSYYWLNVYGETKYANDFASRLASIGNVFKTREQAEKTAKLRKARNYLERVAQDLNGDWEPVIGSLGRCLLFLSPSREVDWIHRCISDLSIVWFKDCESVKKAAEILKRDRPDVLETLFGCTKLAWKNDSN